MRLETGMQQRMNQQQVLAPRMIQSMEIRHRPIMALQERIQQELQENPVLELKETDEPVEGEELDGRAREEVADPGDKELIIDDRGDGEVDFDRLEALNRDWEDHFN